MKNVLMKNYKTNAIRVRHNNNIEAGTINRNELDHIIDSREQ